MTFLPIVERELRVAARRRSTYWLRALLALGVVVIWFFIAVLGSTSNAQRGPVLFMAIGVLAIGFCLLAGIFLTSDSVSEEKREGTLGLLFLTELKGFDVVLGKLMATSLHAFYGLLAILPILSLPLLLGGVTIGEYWRVTVVLVLTLFLSLSLGLLVSVLNHDMRQAMAGTLLAVIFCTGLLPVFWWLQRVAGVPPWDCLLWPSPVFLYTRAFDSSFRYRAGANDFWHSLLTIALLGGFSLILASIRLPRAWQEKGKEAGGSTDSIWKRRWRFGSASFRARRRGRLDANPFYWLASRDQTPKRMAWTILGVLIAIWLCFLAGCFSPRATTLHTSFTVAMFMSFGLHQIFKSFVAVEASRRLNEDHRSGALELLLVTPVSVEQILAGQRRALADFFRGPLALVLLTNAGLFWLVVLMNRLGAQGDAQSAFSEMYFGGALMLIVDFYAISWVGMWMALRTQRHPRAIFGTLARIVFVPWLGILPFFFLQIGGRGTSAETIMGLMALWFLASLMLDLILAARARLGLTCTLRPPIPLGPAKFPGPLYPVGPTPGQD